MLVIKIELHSAITGRVKKIGEMKLWNTGKGCLRRGDYRGEIVLGKQRKTLSPLGHVGDFPRKSLGAFELLRRMLNDMHERRG